MTSNFSSLLYSLLILSISATRYDLGGNWTFKAAHSDQWNGIGNVPGDIYSALRDIGKIPNPLYGDNTIDQKWIGRSDWIYQRTFSLNLNEKSAYLLILDGIDTVASVSINGMFVAKTKNQHEHHYVNITEELQSGENNIEVYFYSPVNYAANQSQEYQAAYNYSIPPDCVPQPYHGECHVNFIRKAQYSFSWDWGPSFPIMGFWNAPVIIELETAELLDFSWFLQRNNERSWLVHADAEFLINGETEINCHAKLLDTETSFKHSFDDESFGKRSVRFLVDVPYDEKNLWWPAGEGKQPLFDFSLNCGRQEIRHRIGFKEVELDQSFINSSEPGLGRNFFFKVNGRPIFLKGTNWIPSSMFVQDDRERVKYLLESAVEVGMNSMRVWGGGIYQPEYFYEMANEAGILIFQDMMFACALYPGDQEFLNSMANEVKQQVIRLRKHVSILLFAGNNENEIGLLNWYTITDQNIADYRKQYLFLMKPLVNKLDPSLSFLLSSPSNGIESERAGGAMKDAGGERYGDVHFYNDFINHWNETLFPTPRCATEYGIQSMPMRGTMLKWIDESEWYYTSQSMLNRQHKGLPGLSSMLFNVYEHFPLQCREEFLNKGQNPKNLKRCIKKGSFMDRFAYFSQAHQALAYKTQTEHYRRFRGRLTSDGRGNTMCALYWQLNDVWAAPTWASVDFELNWKMTHYEAKRFFAPVLASAYIDSYYNQLYVVIVNDRQESFENSKLVIKQFPWGNRFQPIAKFETRHNVKPAIAEEVQFDKRILFNEYGSDFIISAQLYTDSNEKLGPESVILPDRLYEVDLKLVGDVSIVSVDQVSPVQYRILLSANDLSPLTWISWTPQSPGWFSDNGFTMTEMKKVVFLYLQKPTNLTRSSFSVCNIKNCGL